MEDGKLLRRIRISNQIAGTEAGSLFTDHSGKQYRRMRFRRKNYLVHRVIFALVYGYLPETIDHIDGDGLNNYPENLRAATLAENSRNMRSALNTSGYHGVTWDRREKKYATRIQIDRKRKHLGYFDCPVEAARAYDKAAREYHGEFATLNFPDGQYLYRS